MKIEQLLTNKASQGRTQESLDTRAASPGRRRACQKKALSRCCPWRRLEHPREKEFRLSSSLEGPTLGPSEDATKPRKIDPSEPFPLSVRQGRKSFPDLFSLVYLFVSKSQHKTRGYGTTGLPKLTFS